MTTLTAIATTTARRTRATGVVLATVTTSALYLAARPLGTDFKLTDPGKTEAHQLILPEIIVFTLFFSLLGWASLALLERFTRRAQAIWTTLALTITALSLIPIGIEQATPATRAMLVAIHLAVAAVLIPMFRPRSN